MKGFEDLIVYQRAFSAAMQVFEILKEFPKEGRYGLTDQIRRSSRAVCAAISEGYRKRKYKDFLVYKMMEADGECSETLTWLDFAVSFTYICEKDYRRLRGDYVEIGKMLNAIINKPDKFIIR